MTNSMKIIFPVVTLLLSIGVSAQTMLSDHLTRQNLLDRAQHLRQLATQGDGSASETLEKYPHHYTMLAFRSRNGGGELHQNFADMFTILEGHATLITGGEVVDPKTTAPGEIRGSSVKGGSSQELHAGDVVHIPAGTPHQMLIAAGETVTYFVVKIEENR
jgi:mannose-6-phosphate isomerase-like protein (cupin superfamily)